MLLEWVAEYSGMSRCDGMKKLKLAITGVSGFVGKQIFPILQSQKIDFILIGRDKEKLRNQFGSGVTVENYDNLDTTLKNVDGIVHLAVMNNSQDASIEDFRKVNVELLDHVLDAVQKAGVKRMVYVTSLHTLENSQSPYAITKREAEALLVKKPVPYSVATLVLPAVYGDNIYSGKLAILHRFPKVFRRPLFVIMSGFRPTVHASLVAQAIIESIRGNRTRKRFVSDRQMSNWFYLGVTRVIDLLFAFTVICVFWWLLVIIWALVKITSSGPGIFAQERVGRYGKKFVCYKFRTMYVGTKIAGTHEVSAASVTKVGRLIRKFKIDEFPQVWNIILNQMSLVGPRPCLPVQRELIEERSKRGVLDVKCGLTGFSQVLDIDMSKPDHLAEMDAKYLAIRTILLDVKIILQTFSGAGRSDRVDKNSTNNEL